MKTKLILLTLPVALLVACGSEDKASPAEEKGSSGSTSESSSAEQGDITAKVKDILKPEIASFSTKLLMQTPPYLEVEGPLYSTKIKEDAGITLTDLTWKWTSKVDLYSQENSLETEVGEVKVIKKTKGKGEVAEHLAKAVCNLSKDGTVKFQRVSSSDYSFHVSEAGFADLGQPRSRFGAAVELGSDAYMEAVKKAKAYKDAKAEKLRLAVEKAETDRKAKLQAKVDSYLKVYKEGDVFEGTAIAGDESIQVSLMFTKVAVVAGDHIVKLELHQKDYRGSKDSPTAYEGSFDTSGKLVFRSTKGGRGKWRIVNTKDVVFHVLPVKHEDKLRFTATHGRNYKYSATLYRKK